MGISNTIEMDTKVGYATASFLEGLVKDYLIASTRNGAYQGEPRYLEIYESLVEYNKGKNENNK